MPRVWRVFVAGILALVFSYPASLGQVPSVMSYQGMLTNSQGQPLDTTIAMTFSLYDDSLGSYIIWTEQHPSVAVSNGIFNVLLGSKGTPLNDTSFMATNAFLGIKLGSDNEIAPRTRLALVPYARRIGSVDGANGGSVNGVVTIQPDPGYFRKGNIETDILNDSPKLSYPNVRIVPYVINGAAQITLSDRNGNTTMTLDGADSPIGITGSSLLMGNSSYDTTVSIDARYSSKGGRLQLHNHSGQQRLVLMANGSDDGGEITLLNSNDIETVRIIGEYGAAEGSEIRMYNSANKRTIKIDADGEGDAGHIELRRGNDQPGVNIRSSEYADQGAIIQLYNAAGERTIEIDADYGGVGRVISEELEITGGSDLSEQFDVNISQLPILPQEGMVVSIDDNNPGSLNISVKAYDPAVAGIISGAGGINTGLLMGKVGTIANGQYPIALSGRVYCLVDATYEPIKPGDMLTTSDTPGHAMKASDRDRAYGTVIGKAMTGLEKGKGLVLVLVNLQ